MDQKGKKRSANAGGDTVSFGTQKQPVRQAAPAPRKRRKKRIPQRIYRRGRLGAFFYVTGTLAVCVAFAFFFLTAFNDLLAFSKPNKAIEVTIPRGADTKQISQILEDEGLIKYAPLFAFISEYEGYDGKYQHGAHVLNTNMGYTTMMAAMKEKETVRETIQVTIPEGLTINEIAVILDENGVCDGEEFIEKANSNNFGFDFEANIPDDNKIFYRLEGYIFPDTYEFYKDDTALNVIRKFLQNFENKITDNMEDLMRKKGLTLHETLTIASIIQGEATGEEMTKVSSVYWNRINDVLTFPKLQADPTRDYANEQILTHLDDRGRVIADYYNTYTSEGLPPGPINNPGTAAIMAALQPDDTPYYYFCTDLRTKVFYYAETLDQHNANVRKAGLRGWS
ncbi:MAG: endolytic transglycosylase MltG [Oscillospiraceae bacterium]|nr:endolytic transglycosylase MltG [Oscillospiraceae bacterium]